MEINNSAGDSGTLHHPNCYYDHGYCSGNECWRAAEAETRAMAKNAKYAECPICGLPCDGGCNSQPLE